MNQQAHNKLVSFIWSIADSCLRDVYVRGKYRDVILPMVVLRRLDSLLEPTKDTVMEEVANQQSSPNFVDFDHKILTKRSGFEFYNTSRWTLRKLHDTATNNRQVLLANFDEYLSGFSDNIKEIIEKFELSTKIGHMASKDVLLNVLEKFVSPNINLTPFDRVDPDGNKLPALTNLGMGYVFEELIRKFNEENNEEAGEHFTPREVIDLMTHLAFEPIKDNLPPIMTIYDPACGSGGMLTEAQNFINNPEGKIKATSDVYLYGKEVNDETYAICKSDMIIKDNSPENIRNGSTLSTDEFSGIKFDFMLSNPPYGKSWSSEQKNIKDGKDVIDPRFQVTLKNYRGEEEIVDATPRSSDGQLLFLMEMIDKMKPCNEDMAGSIILSIHNGSSLFTGDAGSGESNIRRYIIENDLLDCIIQLPNNLFYNTGITTYIWRLANNKPAERRGKVQLIDASLLYRKLRKNLGNKNCEFSPENIEEITDVYLNMESRDRAPDEAAIAAKIFNNADFGYFKVNMERPDRRKAKFSPDKIESLRFDKSMIDPMTWAYKTYGDAIYTKDCLKENERPILAYCEDQDINLNAKTKSKLLSPDHWRKYQNLITVANQLAAALGREEYDDFNQFKTLLEAELKNQNIKLGASEKNTILNAVSWYDETAAKVVKKREKLSQDKLNSLLQDLNCTKDDLPDFGYYPTDKAGEYLTYESNGDLRDSESVPLDSTIHDYFKKEVKPHMPEAWINLSSVKIGYEISFNKYFYQHKPLRDLDDIAQDILELEQQAEGLIADILNTSPYKFTEVAK
ncbi:MAG: class I SAM-dependent DNA methyltransferase [Alphaproteobacteria bacterium]|nr:class I SAM-dependent DNA methyltransferase [Alphaproteobacteria bacterium]